MRTVLLSSVAALALTLATGSLVPANAQTPTDTAPVQPQPDQSSAATSDQSAPPSTAPVHHRRHTRHTADANVATASGDTGGEHWSHEPGTGQSGPASTKASNISEADTHSNIAPHLPEPAVGEGADADTLLKAAQAALAAHRTGTAQQALEMAETRLLDRSTPVDAANQPDQNATVQQVANARKALAQGDTAGASSAIQTALGGK